MIRSSLIESIGANSSFSTSSLKLEQERMRSVIGPFSSNQLSISLFCKVLKFLWIANLKFAEVSLFEHQI